MAIHKVSSNAVELIVGVADRCDVSLTELCEGLPLDEKKLRRRLGGLEWEFFVELINRLERRIGYPRFEASMSNLPDIGPRSRQMVSIFTSGALLVRFVCTLMGPAMFPMLISTWEEQEHSDGSASGHLTLRLRDGFRDCQTFFKLNGTGISAVPCVIGLPPISVRKETTPRSGEYWLALPRSQTIFGKLKRRAAPEWNEKIAELEEEKARLLAVNNQLWLKRDTEFGQKLDAAAKRWGLTERQTQVLSGLARGQSNKELAKELGCSMKTVETHVTEVLRRASHESRLSLVSSFWRDL